MSKNDELKKNKGILDVDDLGVCDCIGKPFSPHKIIQLI